MADVNAFVDALGADLTNNFAPRIQTEIESLGNQIADETTPRLRGFFDQLIKDVFAQHSVTIKDFVATLIKDVVARYEPGLTGSLHTTIVDQGLQLKSDDARIEIKERTSGQVITSLDIPILVKIQLDDLQLNLESATVQLTNVHL
jgi:hypothetical protein